MIESKTMVLLIPLEKKTVYFKFTTNKNLCASNSTKNKICVLQFRLQFLYLVRLPVIKVKQGEIKVSDAK